MARIPKNKSSTIDPNIPPLAPSFPSAHGVQPAQDSPAVQQLIDHLKVQPHVEGGYFVETDRDGLRVPNPFLPPSKSSPPPSAPSVPLAPAAATRSASTTIHYLLTPGNPLGAFHRNRARTVHTLHRGRGRYVIVHADEVAAPACPGGYVDVEPLGERERWVGKARVETFVVGLDVLKGERIQWIVEGGKYKSSYLLPDEEDGEDGSSGGLLISETVVPGFEYGDHDFMRAERMEALVSREQAEEMAWMLRKVE